MTGRLQPLDEKFPIVGENGRPTLYFIRWAQQRQIDIGEAITAEQALEIAQQFVLDFLADNPLLEGSGIGLTPSGNIADGVTISALVQEILDQITSTQGSVLYRGATEWEALPPGTAGDFLKTNGAAADPEWDAAGGGVEVEDDGTGVVSPASILNFTGAGVTVTDAGGGQADIAIPGGGGGGGGSWSQLYFYDHAVTGDISSPEITGISANEIMIFMEDVRFSSGEVYGFMLSDDNGANWYSSGNPYTLLSSTNRSSSALVRAVSSTSTGPRTFMGIVNNMQDTVAKFGYMSASNAAFWIAPTITTACNAVRIADDPTTDNTVTGGTILVLGR